MGILGFFFSIYFIFNLVLWCSKKKKDPAPEPSVIFLIPLTGFSFWFQIISFAEVSTGIEESEIVLMVIFLATWILGLLFNIGSFSTLIHNLRKSHPSWVRSHRIMTMFCCFCAFTNASNMGLMASNIFSFEAFNAPFTPTARESLFDLALGVFMFKDIPILAIQIFYLASKAIFPQLTLVSMLLTLLTLLFGYSIELSRWVQYSPYFGTAKEHGLKETSTNEHAIVANQKEREKEEKVGEEMEMEKKEKVGEEMKEEKEPNMHSEKQEAPRFREAEQPNEPEPDQEDPKSAEKEKSRKKKANKEAEKPTGQYAREEPTSGFFWFFLYTTATLLTPFAILSFLFHFITLLGGPFAYSSLKNFFFIWTGDYTFERVKKDPKHWTKNWYEERGFYLIPVNILAFSFVGLVFFGLATFFAIFVLVATLLTRLFGRKISFSFRRYYDFVVTCLLWTYLPFWGDPPKVYRDPEIPPPKKIWVIAISFLLFVTLEIGVQILNTVMNFLYGGTLLRQYADPNIGEKEALYGWIIACFTGASLRIISLLINFCWWGYLLWGPESHSLADLVTGQIKSSGSLKGLLVKVFGLVFKDLLCLVVAINTVSYANSVSVVWVLTLAFSIVRLSQGLSGLCVAHFYGKDYNVQAKGVIRLWFFAFFIASLVTMSLLLAKDGFCSLSRTIDTDTELELLTRCQRLEYSVEIQDIELVEDDLYFEAAEIRNFTMQNVVLANLMFFLPSLSSRLTISNSEIEFFELSSEVIEENGWINFSQDNDISELLMYFLSSIQGSVNIHNCTRPNFPSLSSIQGHLGLENIGTVDFFLLREIEGTLSISGANAVFFEQLNQVGPRAQLHLDKVPYFQLSSLLSVAGTLEISNCYNLQEVNFDSLENLEGQIIFRSNPNLKMVYFGSLPSSFQKEHVLFVDNPMLQYVEFSGN